MKIYIKDGFVTDNSNECEIGGYFVRTSANDKFTTAAIQKGAVAIELDECKKLLGINENIKIVGITGTNGKTTTASAIYSILRDLGYGCGLCGTRGAFINGERIDEKSLTTGEILRTLSYLKAASERCCEYFVMEVSSHAITQKRIESLDFSTPSGDLTLNSPLQGEFNLYNLTAAIGCVVALTNESLDKIGLVASKFGGVAGRMEVVSRVPLVIVDFAHTPDGIEKVLNALRHYKIVAVLGAGGDRDRTKRPKMGAIAQKYASRIVITSDNPRSEDPEAIIDEICGGVAMGENAIRIADRKQAIKTALKGLKRDEILVILGKGDEEYQEIKGVKYPFSDKKVVLEILDEIKGDK